MKDSLVTLRYGLANVIAVTMSVMAFETVT